MGDHINVAIRIRPLNQRELRSSTNGTQSLLPWVVQRDTITQRTYADGRVSNGNSFTFDRVFDQKETTMRVYDDVVKQIITSSMSGFNGTIFAYGQTSSGKTHTMHGSNTELGIIKLAVNEMFRIVESDPDREYLIRVSFLEIYNEVLRDLLEPSKSNLKIHENAKRGIFVGDLSEHIVFNVQQVEEVLQKGDRNRHVAGTNMNERSSRSHTIFRIIIESREKTDADADAEGEFGPDGVEQAQISKRQQRLSTSSTDESAEFTGAVKVSCLNLVDLAGSERVGQTGAEGQRLKEGAHINKSLMSLGTVIARLSEDGGDKGHIPYRDSKLTRILQPSIGGNAKTLIVCTITPSPDYVDEALSTLKFASRAKTIQNKPEVNEELRGDALLRRLKRASELEKEVAQMKDIERKKLKIEADNEQLLRQLWKSQKERERLQKELDVQQNNMFLPKNADGKSSVDAVPSFRRQTWFPGLHMPLADGDGGPKGMSNASYLSAAAVEKSGEAMDADDDDDQQDEDRGGSSRRRSHGDSSSNSVSDIATLDPVFDKLVAEKLVELAASNEQLRQQHDDVSSRNKDMEETIHRVMREYNLLLKTLNQLAITDMIPPSPAKHSPASSQQQQPHELVQIRRKLRALMTTIDASQKQCQKFRSQRPEAEFLEMELQAVRETLVQKEEQLVDTLHESDEMYSKLTELESKLAESADICQGLRSELTTAVNDVTSAASERLSLHAQLDSERKKLCEITQAHEEAIGKALDNAMSKHSVEIVSLQSALSEMSQLSDSLQEQLEQVKQTAAGYEKQLSGMDDERNLAIDDLTRQLHEAQIKVTESETKLSDLESQFNQQMMELESKSAACDENAQRVYQLNSSVEQLAQQLAERDSDHAAELAKAQKELGAAIDAHMVEKKHLESLIDERTKENGELQESVRTISDQLKETETEKQMLLSQLSLTSDQANTATALSAEVSRLEKEIAMAGASGDQLRQLLSEKQHDIDSANVEIEHLRAKALKLESQNADVWERVSELTITNDGLNDKLADSAKVVAEHTIRITQLETSAGEMTAARDLLESEIAELTSSHNVSLDDLNRSLAQVQADLDSKVASLAKLESELHASKESAEHASTCNEELVAKVVELKCLLSGERDRAESLQNDLQTMRAEHASLQTEHLADRQDSEQRLSVMTSDLSLRDAQIGELTDRLNSTAADYSSQLNSASKRENAAREDIARLEASLESARSQLSSLQADMADTDKSKSSIVQLNAELCEKLESRSAEVSGLQLRVESLQIAADSALSEKHETEQLHGLAMQDLVDANNRASEKIAELESAVSLKSCELDEAVLAKSDLLEQLRLSDSSKTEHADLAKLLRTELDSENKRISALSHDHSLLVEGLRHELNEHQQRAQEQLDRANEASALAEESCSVLQQRLDELQLTYKDTAKQLEDVELTRSNLAEELRIQQELAEKLSASAGDSELQISDIQQSHRAAIAMMEDKIGTIGAERDRLVSSIHDMTDNLDISNLQVERLQESIRVLKIDHETVLKERSAYEEQAETLASGLQSDIVKLRNQLADADTENSRIQSKVSDVEGQNERLMSQLDDANVSLQEARASENRLRDHVAQLTASCEGSAEQVKELEAKVNKIDDMTQQLAKAKGDALSILSERDRLRDERDSIVAHAKETQVQLEQSISELKDQLSSRSIEIQELESALENANSAILSSQKDSSEQERERVNMLSEQIELLTSQRDRAHSDIDTLKDMMIELARVKDQDISDLKDKLEQFEDLLEASIKESLEKDEAIKESNTIASKHGERAKKASAELEAVLAQHEETVARFSNERSEIQSKLDMAHELADELRSKKTDMAMELKRLQDEYKDVDVELYRSQSTSLREIIGSIRSLPGCEDKAGLVSDSSETKASRRDLLDTARELLAAAVSAATDRKLAESEAPALAQLESELKRLRALNDKLEEKSNMLMDAYKHDMGKLRAEEQSQRQSAKSLRSDLDKQLERSKELEGDLAKAQSLLEKQTEQRVALEARVNRITADVAVSPMTPIKPTGRAQAKSSLTDNVIASDVADALDITPQKAELARLASQRTPIKASSSKRTHLLSREVDTLSPAKMLSPLTSSALNARANATTSVDAQPFEKFPPRKRTPASNVATAADTALETESVAKSEATRARSSYGDRRRIRRNQPPPRKDGLEEQAAEQCVQQ